MYNNYIRLYKESMHYEKTSTEKKKEGKRLSRMVKDVKQLKNLNNKF